MPSDDEEISQSDESQDDDDDLDEYYRELGIEPDEMRPSKPEPKYTTKLKKKDKKEKPMSTEEAKRQ